MDFARFNTLKTSEEGRWMTVCDDHGNPLDAEILVVGPDSMEVNKIAYEEEKDNQKKLSNIFANAGTKNKKISVDEQEDQPEDRVQKNIDRAVRITKGWKNIDWLGQELPFNTGNASMLYTNVSILRKQVLEYSAEISNFIEPGQQNSKKRSGKDSSLITQEKKA